jgi:hypothetical protein
MKTAVTVTGRLIPNAWKYSCLLSPCLSILATSLGTPKICSSETSLLVYKTTRSAVTTQKMIFTGIITTVITSLSWPWCNNLHRAWCALHVDTNIAYRLFTLTHERNDMCNVYTHAPTQRHAQCLHSRPNVTTCTVFTLTPNVTCTVFTLTPQRNDMQCLHLAQATAYDALAVVNSATICWSRVK